MGVVTITELLGLDEYESHRPEIQNELMLLRQTLRLSLGSIMSLAFENRRTVWYQIQEMLRIEKIFEPLAIEEEILAYNPLIPDGTNWKATLMFEYPDPLERNQALANMTGIEHQVWTQVDGFEKNFANANDDLDRTNENKTAAVHFLRFEFNNEEIDAMKNGEHIELGIDHELLDYTVQLIGPERTSLIQDFD